MHSMFNILYISIYTYEYICMCIHTQLFFNFRKNEAVQPPECKGEKTLPPYSWLPLGLAETAVRWIPGAQWEQRWQCSQLWALPWLELFRFALRGKMFFPLMVFCGCLVSWWLWWVFYTSGRRTRWISWRSTLSVPPYYARWQTF